MFDIYYSFSKLTAQSSISKHIIIFPPFNDVQLVRYRIWWVWDETVNRSFDLFIIRCISKLNDRLLWFFPFNSAIYLIASSSYSIAFGMLKCAISLIYHHIQFVSNLNEICTDLLFQMSSTNILSCIWIGLGVLCMCARSI